MKQLIVLIAMISLGIYIASLVSGDNDGTIKNSMTNMWQSEISRQNTYP